MVMQKVEPDQVKKRAVFYIPGLDLRIRNAEYYHTLYKQEALMQSQINGMKFHVSDMKTIDKHLYSWDITSKLKNSSQTETRFFFLNWSDIPRQYYFLSLSKAFYYWIWICIINFEYTRCLLTELYKARKSVIVLLWPLNIDILRHNVIVLKNIMSSLSGQQKTLSQ